MDPSLTMHAFDEMNPDNVTLCSADLRTSELTTLLSNLEDPPHIIRGTPLDLTPDQENMLVQVRLGMASSLFTSLKWKHEPTAKHCLRVALGCSMWAHRIGLPIDERDRLEVASLLHDIGKIGVPDAILCKPQALAGQEMAVMEGHWLIGLDILRHCCASKELQEIVLYSRAWYDGSKRGLSISGELIPLGARMLAIVDAFDSMTTDHVYRPARSRERAFHELYRCAGKQFDPQLVKSFCELHECDQQKLLEMVPHRWLQVLDPTTVNTYWQLNESQPTSVQRSQETLFERRLLENMGDAVIFIDAAQRIMHWNAAAERLTGLSAESVHQRLFLPSLLDLRNEHYGVINDEQCPFLYAMRTGTQWMRRRMHLRGRGGNLIPVDASAVPVLSEDGSSQGLALLIYDVSDETTLEERCQSLHELAKRDPLTQLANRAEFDRLLDVFVVSHAESKRPCSIIMADIDHFKQINDTYGHQAGDEVIRNFAALLKGSCRAGDLVARYGGEEFVMLCSDCDSGAVARRAELLRHAFSRTAHQELASNTVTASFGVTELQPGDTAETMLRRADRALLNAKEDGRNRVVQLGAGNDVPTAPPRTRGWFRRRKLGDVLIEERLASDVPLTVSIEKLRGFIADHHAHVISIHGNLISLSIKEGPPARPFALDTDRPSHFIMDIDFREERVWRERADGTRGDGSARTLVHVTIRPESSRERRKKIAAERARQLLTSLRAYLMAVEPVESRELSVLQRAKHFLAPWWAKK